ncbi:MAG: RluA family pseudouridine synthase, partial [Clostridiales Family XIII bacterium]|nr:RluA family pseudouridine synthase [Clostridiales Family XIII bacterium]
KPPGIVVHPTKGHPDGTLANGIAEHMRVSEENYKPRFINRLDMDTSGVLLVGKNAYAQNYFTKESQNGRVKKQYIALVHGVPVMDSGVIDLPIGLPDDGNPKRIVRSDGASSITHYTRLGTRWVPEIGEISLLQIRLETGRTHQIRVHLSHMGNPIVGDRLYGEEFSDNVTRQALHAISLEFTHPVSGAPLLISAPIPNDILNLIGEITFVIH